MTDPSAPAAELADGLRAFMRGMAATVTIITTEWEGQPHGMAATAVTSLSFDPPSLLFCINRSASIWAPLRASGIACINALNEGHDGLCGIFSGKAEGAARFDHGRWERAPGRPPRLLDARASVLLRTVEIGTHGTHAIFLGDVIGAGEGEGADPLVYLDRRFGGFRHAG